MVFRDSDLVPLLVHENYVNGRATMGALARAADAISAADVVNQAVHRNQRWDLLPFFCILGAVYPAAHARQERGGFPRFPAWLGCNSSSIRQRRLLGEIASRMPGHRCTELRLHYMPVLRHALTVPLASGDFAPVIRTMRDYGLRREDLDAIVGMTGFKTGSPWGKDPLKAVGAGAKGRFTRAFNKAILTSHDVS